METHRDLNDEGLIATLTNARFYGVENLDVDVWTEERTVDMRAPSPGLVQVDPTLVFYLSSTFPNRPVIRTKSTDSLNRYIADCMSSIEKVRRIYSNYRESVFYTWILIEERNRNVQKLIYEKERQIIERFHDTLFDFYVVYGSGLDPDTVVSGVELVYDRDRP